MRVVLGRWSAAVLLVAAACSGGSSPASKSSSSPSPTPTTCLAKQVPITFPQCPISEIGTPKDLTSQGDNVQLKLIAGDAIWDPTFIKVKAGAFVTLTIEGGVPNHDFNITSLKVKHPVPPLTTTTVSFQLPLSGPVIFYCAPHLPNGMQGAFYFA